MTYAVGDIHGCLRSFDALLERLPLQSGDVLILLGDLIDRGPDSRGVIDRVWQLRQAGHPVVCLRGNHEQLLLDALPDPAKLDLWLYNGGRQTLLSFRINHPMDLPGEYLEFLMEMPIWHQAGAYLCVHGGIDFSKPHPLDHPEILLWRRNWYEQIDYDWLADRTILHGHTPTDLAVIQQQHRALTHQRYLNLDNGCVYACMGLARDDWGSLLAFCLDTGELFIQNCVDANLIRRE